MIKKGWKQIVAVGLAGLLFVGGQTVSVRADDYQGIRIDGDFSDWNAVHKVEVNDGKLNEVAFVFDGDKLFFYVDACLNYTAGMIGDSNNGKCSVVTDLGYTMMFQMADTSSDPKINGVTGAEIAYSDLTWGTDSYRYEFSIPASQLPNYRETVSFGEYLGDVFVSDVANLQGTDTTGKEFNGIQFDGAFMDWNNYPHCDISYSGSGTQANVPDAEAAAYLSNGYLYGHVYTMLQAHLDTKGGDLLSGISIGINDLPDRNSGNGGFWPGTVFYPQFITVDEQGNINYSPQLSGLPIGAYEFYIIDSAGWKSATNVMQWEDPAETYIYGTNHVYGKATLVIGPSKQEMEFTISVELLAKRFSMEPEELHAFCVQFGRLGWQWVSSAGTSTGPWVGVAVCVGTTGVVLVGRKRRRLSIPAA